jgi:hypothetical protein
MLSISPQRLSRNGEAGSEARPSIEDLRQEVRRASAAVVEFVEACASSTATPYFKDFERGLREPLSALARAAIVLFLALVEARLVKGMTRLMERGGRVFRKAPAQARNLGTWWGPVRYWRTYLRELSARKKRRGFHPLDLELGLVADRFSWNVLTTAVRLATRLAFAEARGTMELFVPQPPSTEVVEQAVLGLGRHAKDWFEVLPAPKGDGEVLITLVDGKGAPTATQSELSRRRGKRKKRPKAASPRHRGRDHRGRWPKKPRRKKGDKSKNAKMATVVVMYTLHRQGDLLLGPINRRIYVSFGPKRHAFEWARAQADRRGFGPGSGKVHQVLTDGDNHYAPLVAEYFPGAIHTCDVMHVVEKLWKAGECLFREGTDALRAWVSAQKDRLYGGRIKALLDELRGRLEGIAKTGPGNAGKRKRLGAVLRYIEKRRSKLKYRELIAEDLELGTGMVEGVLKNLLGKRCDHGGMRWIKERCEALVQLRCVDMNGDWAAFTDWVHERNRRKQEATSHRVRLQTKTAAPLPTVEKAAA